MSGINGRRFWGLVCLASGVVQLSHDTARYLAMMGAVLIVYGAALLSKDGAT